MNANRNAVRLSSENRLNSILEAVDAAILTIDGDGIIIECNNATSRMFGYEKPLMVGHNVRMLMPEPYRSEHDGYINNHLSTGINKIIGTGRKVSGLHQSGRVFPVHLSVAGYTENDALYFTGILHDLSELDEARSLSERLGQIVEESVNEIYTLNAETVMFTGANRAALANLGYTLDQLQTCLAIDVLADLTPSDLAETVSRLRADDKRRLALQTRLARSDGSRYDAELALHFSTTLDPPEVAIIAQDVTEKNRLIESLHRNQRMESIGNLTGGIAHDFNNILTVIMGNLDLLSTEIEKPDNIEMLDDARDAAEMGARLTRRLLTFARRSPLSPNTINVNRLIADLTEMLTRTLGSNIALENHLSESLWNTSVDVSELENALVNLVINAKDAMPDGGRLLIETANASLEDGDIDGYDFKPGEYVRIAVTDTGSGIPEEIKDTLFDPFITSKKGGKGSGLGLSMVHGFVHQSGGGVTVYSEAGSGTVFSLYLPRAVSGGEPESPVTLSHPQRPVSGRTILVAEDDDRVRKLTVKRIRTLGHTVIEAVDGHMALQIYSDNPHIDLVFTDVVMTEGMTGYDLAVAIRRIDPQLPVLLTSGYAEDIINAAKLRESGLSLLRKPYHQNDLEAMLSEMLS